MPQPQVLLASASARRAELLRQIGIHFETLSVEVDETPGEGESPEIYVQRLAVAKARAGWQASARGLPVLAADTAIKAQGVLLGKPADENGALAMLAALSGREHLVCTSVALVGGEHRAQRLSRTRVLFRDIGTEECKAYWRTGEPAGKAGAYALQGKAAAFVRELHGSYSGVVGLPLFETAELLAQCGIRVL